MRKANYNLMHIHNICKYVNIYTTEMFLYTLVLNLISLLISYYVTHQQQWNHMKQHKTLQLD